jgi:UDP-galactose transporter B1
MDGLLASCQNFLKKTRPNLRPPDAIETMLWMNLYAIVYLVPLTVLSGQLDMKALLSMWYKIAVLNMTVAAGQVFIFLTITWYSPVMTTTITTTRKFFTILLSVWTYGHHFSTWQWLAVALVFTGLYLSILMIRKPHGVVDKKKD